MALHGGAETAARRWPERRAVENATGGGISYRELGALSDRVRIRLARLGVAPGDRVGLDLNKSIGAVAAMLGVLKAGAAYVPVDPYAPPARNALILADCGVRALVAESALVAELAARLRGLGCAPPVFEIAATGDGGGLDAALAREQQRDPAPAAPSATPGPDDVAYILYTSGSTGRPKGVTLSHRNAGSFVDWCSATFAPSENDRLSSHAPFHFDLSILDLYLAFAHGATVVLFGHELGKDPNRLAPLIAERRISVWYSTPSILSLLARYGQLGRYDYSALRLVLFAGEVFPVKQLRAMKRQIPHPRYFNLYGPTETNVCTFYEIPREIPEARTEPFPIGRTCSHLRSRVVGVEGIDVERGEEGELCIAGPAVTVGYWNLPERTSQAFLADADGGRWYRTGDLVFEDERGDYVFRGRRDRMVKRRGYRVELDEIEVCLHTHEAVHRAAVIALPGEEGVTIKAFIRTRDGGRLSQISLKRFCAERLPAYMIPDRFSFHAALPTTSTDKVDYQALQTLA